MAQRSYNLIEQRVPEQAQRDQPRSDSEDPAAEPKANEVGFGYSLQKGPSYDGRCRDHRYVKARATSAGDILPAKTDCGGQTSVRKLRPGDGSDEHSPAGAGQAKRNDCEQAEHPAQL